MCWIGSSGICRRSDGSRSVEDVFWRVTGRSMETKHIQGVGSSPTGSSVSGSNSGNGNAPVFEPSSVQAPCKTNNRMVYARLTALGAFFPIGKLFEPKGAIPIIIENRDQIKSSLSEKVFSQFPSISDILGLKPKIAEIADHLHQKALLTPDPSDDKIDYAKYLYDYVSAAPLTHFAPDWFKEIVIYITAALGSSTNNAVQWLLSWAYKFVTSVVLWTPEWLFEGDWFPSSVFKFSVINMGIVVVFTMIQGIKRICRMSHTPLSYVLKRLPLAITISAATPYIFTHGTKILNKLTKFILNIGQAEIANNKALDIFASTVLMAPLNILIMIGFIVLTAFLCVPMFIVHGRRWFNLLIQGMLTPFAMSAFLFKDTKHYFNLWLSSIKESVNKQLIYAIFVTLLGLIMFATPNPTTFVGMLTKCMVLIGGLHTLAYPPSIVNQLAGHRDTGEILGSTKEVVKKGKEIWKKGKQVKISAESKLISGASIAGKFFRFLKKI